jgi:hypothetical protein
MVVDNTLVGALAAGAGVAERLAQAVITNTSRIRQFIRRSFFTEHPFTAALI